MSTPEHVLIVTNAAFGQRHLCIDGGGGLVVRGDGGPIRKPATVSKLYDNFVHPTLPVSSTRDAEAVVGFFAMST